MEEELVKLKTVPFPIKGILTAGLLWSFAVVSALRRDKIRLGLLKTKSLIKPELIFRKGIVLKEISECRSKLNDEIDGEIYKTRLRLYKNELQRIYYHLKKKTTNPGI